MMTFVSLINPAFPEQDSWIFVAISTSSTQHCAQRMVGDQQIFSGGKEGEREERRPLAQDANRKKKKPSCMLAFGLWSKNVCPQPVAPK